MFKCTACGYIPDGDAAPATCPKCGAPAEKFQAVASDAAALIEKSRHTNGLHMQLINIFEEVIAIAVNLQAHPRVILIACLTNELEQVHVVDHTRTRDLRRKLRIVPSTSELLGKSQ